MALKEYEVVTEGRHPRKTTMLLNEADAKRYGVLGNEVTAKAAKVPANKAGKPAADKTAAAKVSPPAVPKSEEPATPADVSAAGSTD